MKESSATPPEKEINCSIRCDRLAQSKTLAGGFAAGGLAGGDIESGVSGAFSALAFFAVGETLGHGSGD
jgi:hypothetical protein